MDRLLLCKIPLQNTPIRKGMFQMRKYLNQFVFLKPVILSYGCEVWGLILGMSIGRLHLKCCKQIVGVKLKREGG